MEVDNRILWNVRYPSQDLVGGYQALVDLVKSDLGNGAGTNEAN